MQQQFDPAIVHPLAVDTKITAMKPSCPCKNAKYEQVVGIVKKVIQNQAGYWYYLGDIGVTVRGDWIKFVHPQ